ncbi:MAG: SUMF1/EgtB/PvdO family nonheme iron enzyme [Crocinitomicaceae bacterium]|nr:SUMF1/EgtB/PvdO family nonheme iron enzyme [Crocinitomicaceae bacterium]
MDNQQNIDALFAKAKLTPTAIPFNESKDLFIKNVPGGSSASKGKGRFFNLINLLIMIGILGTLSFFIVFSVSTAGKETSGVTLQYTEKQGQVTKADDATTNEPLQTETITSGATENKRVSWADLIKTIPPREIYLKRVLTLHDRRYTKPLLQEPSLQYPDHTPFPKLTDAEIAANHRQKRKMVKALSKFDRKKYSYIPSGSYLYKGDTVSVQSFFMRREEVTNLEYRTFLFDLLIQDRKNDFLNVAPDQTLWTTALDDSLISFQKDYFSNVLYNGHPVVNVSEKGVQMYCDWLTIETNKLRDDDPINDVRIPQLFEWTYAASNLGKQTTYPWEGKSLTTNDVFNANFKLDQYKGSLDQIKPKTKKKRHKVARTTFEHTVGLMIAWTKTYEPNELGLYNMSGNVAEMVSTTTVPNSFQIAKPNEKQLVTCGGSWMSSPEDLKVFNESLTDYIDGHPSVGFRVVVTYFSQN